MVLSSTSAQRDAMAPPLKVPIDQLRGGTVTVNRHAKKEIVMILSSLVKIVLLLAVVLVPLMVMGQTGGSGSLKNPAGLKEKAPETFKVDFDTSKGKFVVEVTRAWAPNGADRFYNLVKNGFFNDVRFFRVISGFMVQFGISGDPSISAVWRTARIPDDPVKQSNKRGYITFATSGPNSRTTQVFINFRDNAGLDSQGFSPFGTVITGMDVVDKLFSGYGEGAPGGRGPNQGQIQAEGNAYLTKGFPEMDYVKTATIGK
jgi:peptidyl-prolyl cis-trans isomerase A (cyclophilin A)